MSQIISSEREGDRRRRGRRPADANERRSRVLAALQELEQARVPFSMQDLAERAGISRATLYRDATLRDLVGARGDGPPARPVDYRAYEALQRRCREASAERGVLRREVGEMKRRLAELEERCQSLQQENLERMRSAQVAGGDEERVRADAYADGFAAGMRMASNRAGGARGAGGGLLAVAARLPRPSIAAARRTLARALHPDLFARDPAAALLATEILKQLNSLTDS